MRPEYQARPAEDRDVDAVIRLAEAELSEAPVDMPYSEVWMRRSLGAIMKSPLGFAGVLDHEGEVVGMLLATATESPISPILVSMDVSFYVDVEHRGHGRKPLIDAYRAWGLKVGVKKLGIGLFHEPRNVPVMARLGFEAVETHFFSEP